MNPYIKKELKEIMAKLIDLKRMAEEFELELFEEKLNNIVNDLEFILR